MTRGTVKRTTKRVMAKAATREGIRVVGDCGDQKDDDEVNTEGEDTDEVNVDGGRREERRKTRVEEKKMKTANEKKVRTAKETMMKRVEGIQQRRQCSGWGG
jgi:chromatin segregation and condensation protein Rec8/ScpA/Scc1 (kleisin family)